MAVQQEKLAADLGIRAPPRPVSGTVHRTGVWLALAGWLVMGLMWVTGSVDLFGHDQEGSPAVLAIGLFLTGWLAMVAAMMLPSSLPTLRSVDQVLGAREERNAAGFMLGYFSAWGVFGAAAFLGDGMLHQIVASWPWLAERPSLILGGIAMFAGAAEVLGRTPPPVTPVGGPGVGSFVLGRTHAFDRIRRCWPMMLFAMAVGMSNPLWMVSLTCVMTLELRPKAHLPLRLIGFGLFMLGVAAVAEPAWTPILFGGTHDA